MTDKVRASRYLRGISIVSCISGVFLSGGCEQADSTTVDSAKPEASAPAETGPDIDRAIAMGDIEAVHRIIENHPEAAGQGRNPRLPPLSAAILRKKPDIARFLIESGADVDATDSSGRSPVHLAVERGLVQIVGPLAEAGADLDMLDGVGWTPLHWAAAKDNLAMMEALVAAGADPQARTVRGGTILHEAASSGGAEVVAYVLSLGIDPTVVASDGGTALEVAREFENAAAVSLLEERAKP